MKKKDIIIITSIIVAVIILGSITYFTTSKSKTTTSKTTGNYSLYTIPSPQTIFLEGEFQNVQKITYQADATKGTLDSVSVNDKQSVTAGTVLFTYKNSQILDQVDTLQNQLDTLKNTYSRLEKQAKSTGSQGYSEIAAQLEDNKQQQKQLNSQIYEMKNKAYSSVVAPFDGTVSKSSDNLGDSTKPILTLMTPKMQIVSSVSEKDVLKLSLNQEVEVTMVSTGRVTKGKISFIATTPGETSTGNISAIPGASMQNSSTGSSTSSYSVYIDVENQQDTYPGFHAQISANSQKDLPKIPKTSVFTENGVNYVWNVNEGALKKVEVTTEDFNEKYLLVKSGLAFEDKIVRQSNDTMKEGDTVDITNN
ncbi:MAG: efflux RND transporter periplasmic adaptor subunit [Clostridiaceae bacterium]